MGFSRKFKKTVSVIVSLILTITMLPNIVFANDEADELDLQAIAGGNNTLTEVTIPATDINIIKGSNQKLDVGQSFQIEITLKPKKSNDYVTYKSLKRSVAIVDSNGYVTAVGPGKATIRIKTSKNVKKDIIVEVFGESSVFPIDDETPVVQQQVSSIDLLDSAVMLRSGKTTQIEHVFYPYGSTDKITYTSANTKIAKVSSSGLVTAVSDGSTFIYLETPSGIKAEFYVTVYSDLLKGIDVSKWQDEIDWKKVSKSGIDFVMIRSSFGKEHVDNMLEYNIAGCEEYGIPYGFYHYTYATTVAEAKTEAKFFLKTIKNYNPEYPVVLDIEEPYFKSYSRKKNTDIIVAFMTELERAGYYASIYSSANFFTDQVDMERLSIYDIWVACWGDSERLNSFYDYHYGMWQYSATGKVNGIKGDVDLDYAYKDYADIIRSNGLNNLRY